MERADRTAALNVRAWARSLERAAPHEQRAMLCWLAGQSVPLPPDEQNAAVRRAELLLATGGDPRRELDLYGRAVSAVAADLDDPARRSALLRGLAALAPDLEGLRGASEGLRLLAADPDLAWQSFALAVLADALAEEV